MLNWIWKRSLITLLLAIVFTLSACTSPEQGLMINWTIVDDQMIWDAVDGAAYYQVLRYDINDLNQAPIPYQDYYVYQPKMPLMQFTKNLDHYIGLRVFYPDGTTKDSQMMHFYQDMPLPYPFPFSYDYHDDWVTWQSAGFFIPKLVNFTLKVNDEEFIVGTANTDDYPSSEFQSGVNEISIRANYTNGHSDYSPVKYIFNDIQRWTNPLYYDPSLNEDLTFTLDLTEPIIFVHGYYPINNYILDDSIITISGNVFTINRYFIESHQYLSSYGVIYIVTNECMYYYNISDISQYPG